MQTPRKVMAVTSLVLISLILTVLQNNIGGTIFDFATNLYLAGLATLVCSLLVHQVIVRRVFPRNQIGPQFLGLAISGVFAITLHEWLRVVAARITYIQRQGTNINWGDDGLSSGLSKSAFGLDYSGFWSHLPVTLGSAVIYGIIWFPVLLILERWTYSDKAPSHPDSISDHA